MDARTTAPRQRVKGPGYKIRAVVWTDDGQHKIRFDAEGWFKQANEAELVELHQAEYENAEADILAHFAHEAEKDKGVRKVFKYLTVYKPRNPRTKQLVGFEVRCNPADVYHWLREHNPVMANYLFPDGQPDDVKC